MTSTARHQQIDRLAQLVMASRRRSDHRTLRVAVTGITASGKSTVARQLADALGALSFRIAVDEFHNPRAIRYQRGRESAEGYYRDAYDYPLLRESVLLPLGPGGDGRYLPRGFDLAADARVDGERVEAPPGSIAVLDASFLLRPETRELFDYKIFVQTSFEAAESRGVARDAAALGGEAEARRLYRVRYHEAQRIYFREADPLRYADVIVDNE